MPLKVKGSHDVVTVASVTSVATAGTNTDSVRLPRSMQAVLLVFDVSAAATDAGDKLDVKVQTMLDGVNWVDVAYFTQVLGNGGVKRFVMKVLANTAETLFAANTALTAGGLRHLMGDEWRVNYVVVNAGAVDVAFTFSVKACPM
jgi:hypothetical protein